MQAEVAPAFRATKDSLRYCLLSDLRFDQSQARVARPHASRLQRASLRKTHVQSVPMAHRSHDRRARYDAPVRREKNCAG